jgi:hypothetical protein
MQFGQYPNPDYRIGSNNPDHHLYRHWDRSKNPTAFYVTLVGVIVILFSLTGLALMSFTQN